MNIACSISIGDDYLTLELNEVGKDDLFISVDNRICYSF